LLSIEQDELGISAGLQDRVIQSFGGLVHMDFTRSKSDKNIYTAVDIELLPHFYLAYNISAGGDSGKVHLTVRQRWKDGDEDIMRGMKELAKLADFAVDALHQKNYTRLADLMDINFTLRREMYGDAVVGESNIAAIELAQTFNFGAKFSGSGGAILCLHRTKNEDWLSEGEETNIRQAFALINFGFIRVLLPHEEI
jgi:glucuronokinase